MKSTMESTYEGRPAYRELLLYFAKALGGRYHDMVTAYKEKDYDKLQSMAHRMKGTAATYGYPKLALIADKLERALTCPYHDDLELARLMLCLKQTVRAISSHYFVAKEK